MELFTNPELNSLWNCIISNKNRPVAPLANKQKVHFPSIDSKSQLFKLIASLLGYYVKQPANNPQNTIVNNLHNGVLAIWNQLLEAHNACKLFNKPVKAILGANITKDIYAHYAPSARLISQENGNIALLIGLEAKENSPTNNQLIVTNPFIDLFKVNLNKVDCTGKTNAYYNTDLLNHKTIHATAYLNKVNTEQRDADTKTHNPSSSVFVSTLDTLYQNCYQYQIKNNEQVSTTAILTQILHMNFPNVQAVLNQVQEVYIRSQKNDSYSVAERNMAYARYTQNVVQNLVFISYADEHEKILPIGVLLDNNVSLKELDEFALYIKDGKLNIVLKSVSVCCLNQQIKLELKNLIATLFDLLPNIQTYRR